MVTTASNRPTFLIFYLADTINRHFHVNTADTHFFSKLYNNKGLGNVFYYR